MLPLLHYNGRRYYYDKGMLITDRKMIRNSYLRGWFVIDVISVLPFDHLVQTFLTNIGISAMDFEFREAHPTLTLQG